MRFTFRSDRDAYIGCGNRQSELDRVPQIIGSVGVTGYKGVMVCRKTVAEGRPPLIGEVGQLNHPGEFNDGTLDDIGPKERQLVMDLHYLGELFAEELGCRDCPFRKQEPSEEVLDAAVTLPSILEQVPTDPDLARQFGSRITWGLPNTAQDI